MEMPKKQELNLLELTDKTCKSPFNDTVELSHLEQRRE